mmetsp:Transcript_40918/g.97969  ORF Transcript_40918/g.97969 Transcript_40918/m.97969 type:complete len:80 (-) Transcript_40918:769-1008(-)
MYHRIWKCAVRSEKIFLFFFFKLYIYTNALYYTYIQIKSFFLFPRTRTNEYTLPSLLIKPLTENHPAPYYSTGRLFIFP